MPRLLHTIILALLLVYAGAGAWAHGYTNTPDSTKNQPFAQALPDPAANSTYYTKLSEVMYQRDGDGNIITVDDIPQMHTAAMVAIIQDAANVSPPHDAAIFRANVLQNASSLEAYTYLAKADLPDVVRMNAVKIEALKGDLGPNAPEAAGLRAFLKAEPTGAKAWEKLSDLNSRTAWTRKSIPLLDKMKDKPEAIQDKVRQYYGTHQRPSGMLQDPPADYTTSAGEVIHFDDYGHPRFESFVPHMDGVGKIAFNPDQIVQSGGTLPAGNGGRTTLMGSNGSDEIDANRWSEDNYPSSKFIAIRDSQNKITTRCKIKIKDDNGQKRWVECVWHHYEDGRNMIPVPIGVHNRAEGGASHTGGRSVIDKAIKDFFPSLTF